MYILSTKFISQFNLPSWIHLLKEKSLPPAERLIRFAALMVTDLVRQLVSHKHLMNSSVY